MSSFLNRLKKKEDPIIEEKVPDWEDRIYRSEEHTSELQSR